jgi:hypothetical protein
MLNHNKVSRVLPRLPQVSLASGHRVGDRRVLSHHPTIPPSHHPAIPPSTLRGMGNAVVQIGYLDVRRHIFAAIIGQVGQCPKPQPYQLFI